MKRIGLLIPMVAALGACCLSDINGIATAGSGMGGPSTAGATSSAASSSGGVAATSSGTTSASSSGGGTTGTTGGPVGTTGTTGGGSTGIPQLTLPPLLLMDAGPDTVFGPVALAPIPSPSAMGAARLVYSAGDGGPYDILVQTLGGNGGPLGAPVSVAVTGVDAFQEDGGPLIVFSLAPQVAVSDDGTTVSACWEDLGGSTNPYALCDGYTELVLCASLPEAGGEPDPIYSNCGGSPLLTFNASSGTTRLLFTAIAEDGYFLETWEVGQGPAAAEQIFFSEAISQAAAALRNGSDGALFSPLESFTQPSGLYLAQGAFGDAGYAIETISDSESAFNDNDPNPIAAASDPVSGSIAVLESSNGSLTEVAFVPQGATAPMATGVPSAQPVVGAVAATTCPGTFAYFATTAFDTVLFAQATFDGGLLPDKSRYLQLADFVQAPSFDRVGLFSPLLVPATSMAAVPAPGGNLLLAISTPWQLGVYLVSCE